MKIPQWIYNLALLVTGALLTAMVLGLLFGWIAPGKEDLAVKWASGIASFLVGLIFNKGD